MKSKIPQLYGAPVDIQQTAKFLRSDQTRAEEYLWKILRNRQVKKHKFRRQHSVAGFIVDFYCHDAKLVIELDGKIHDKPNVKEKDISRQQYLENAGLTVLRFKNEDVLEFPEMMVDKIISFLN